MSDFELAKKKNSRVFRMGTKRYYRVGQSCGS